MAALVVVLGIGVVALPGLLARLGRQLNPKEWTYLSAIAIAGGMVLVEGGLLLLAAPTLLRAVGVPALANACERLLSPVVATESPIAGWTAAAAAVGLGAALTRALVVARRLRSRLAGDLWLGERDRIGTCDVVVLPLGVPFAAALEGDDPCIVLSRELRDSLPSDQLEAVVAHEAAHLAARHGRFLVLAAAHEQTLGRVLAPLKPSASSLRLAVERWADEDASAGSPQRRQALLSALLGIAHAHVALPLATLTDATTVITRIEALGRPPSRPRLGIRLAAYLPGSMLGAGAVAALGTWTGQVHMLLSMTGRCPVS